MIEKASGLVLDTVALAAPAERGNSSTDLGSSARTRGPDHEDTRPVRLPVATNPSLHLLAAQFSLSGSFPPPFSNLHRAGKL